MGAGSDDDDFDDALRRFMEQMDEMSASEAPREPRYAERQRAARQADLQRRIAEEQAHARYLAERDRRLEQRRTRSSRHARWLAPLVVVMFVAAAVYFSVGRGQESVAGSPEVRRPSDWPSVPADVSETPLATPSTPTAESSSYKFGSTQSDGSPVTWDPCRPIHYVVNPAGQPPDGDVLVQDAIARTSAATGLQFVDDGLTDETWSEDRASFQPDRYGDRWAPVLITWSTPEAVPALTGPTAGQGGPLSLGYSEDEMTSVTGSVVLDAPQLSIGLESPEVRTQVRAVIQHELGHVVGLVHVEDPSQLMNPEATLGTTEWGPGDLQGLYTLGTGPCRPEL